MSEGLRRSGGVVYKGDIVSGVNTTFARLFHTVTSEIDRGYLLFCGALINRKFVGNEISMVRYYL